MAALGMTAVSLTSCDSSCKPVKELANASDSLVYAVGVLTGTDVNSGIQNLGQPVDIDQFIKGAKKRCTVIRLHFLMNWACLLLRVSNSN